MATNAHSGGIRVGALLPQSDPRSWLAYALFLALALGAYVFLTVSGLQLGAAWAWGFLEVAAVLIFVAWMLRRAGHPAISTGLETISLAYLVGSAGLILQPALMALPFPFADALLSRWDRALGFDWWTFTQLFSNRWLWGAMFVAYASLIPQTLVLLILLSATNRHDRAWQFVTASTLALVVTMIVMPFFPADGSLALCSLKPGSPWLAAHVCDYGPVIHQLKAGQITVLAGNALQGMVSMPSFHTAMGLQFMWAFWPYRWLRWPMVVFNSLLICGTVALASHYFVDLLGGAVIGILAIRATSGLRGRGSREIVNVNPASVAGQTDKSPLVHRAEVG